MTPEQFETEKEYQSRMSIIRSILKLGLITKSEYNKINTKFLEKHSPIFGSIYRWNSLISSFTRGNMCSAKILTLILFSIEKERN